MEFKSTASITELRALWKEAFGDSDNYLDLFFCTAYKETHFMAAFIENELAAALYWFDCELNGQKSAYIYAVATAKRQRGKGVASALMAHTHLLLKENAYSLALLVPSETSLFNFYEKLGYKTCGFVNELNVQSEVGEVSLEKIYAEEYFNIRKAFAPKNSVNLLGYPHFTNAQYDFYKGENFILCKNKSYSFFPEFLGDENKIPFILSTLKLQKAKIRTIGNKKPFCMGTSLNGSPIDKNIYFPFAFD